MEWTLEYFALWIERSFYERNSFLLDQEGICSAKKGLPCNCLTGLTVNYWAYAVRNCQHMDWECTFDLKGNLSCIFVAYQGKRILPAVFEEKDDGEYWLSGRICSRERVSHDKVYIENPSVEEYNNIVRYTVEKESKVENRITEYAPMYDFLSCFMTAVRTQPIEKEGKALFAIVLFFFPNRTMKLVHEYMCNSSMGENGKEYIKKFMKEYDQFLDKLKCYQEYGFLDGFSALFKELTGIYVGEWIAEIINRQKDGKFWKEALSAAYNRNMEERDRRGSRYKKVMKACEKGFTPL